MVSGEKYELTAFKDYQNQGVTSLPNLRLKINLTQKIS